jgi:large subunit ribosomal protein L17
MRHRVAHRKLGRPTEHRIALLRSQADALIRHERIETTVPKAKELRPFVERLITIAKRGLAVGTSGRTLTARRLVLRDLQDRQTVAKLFDTIAPRFETRPGGYTRLLRLGYRKGDSAEMAQVELVGSEYNPRGEKAKAAEPAAPVRRKGVGGRIRAAASRLRGRPQAPAEDAPEAGRSPSPGRSRSGSQAAKRGPGKKGSS